jgi:la-related protein 4
VAHAQTITEGEALKEAIKKQIDWYFSKDNLATDRFLLSQMNQEVIHLFTLFLMEYYLQMFVPIKIIAEFKMLKNMTTDFDYLVSVMKECKSVIVDENTMMVKPNMKAYRNTIILRDIPSSTPEAVGDLFKI